MSKFKEEKTLVIIKPDGVKRGLVGEVIKRIEQRGLKIIALNMFWPTEADLNKHYPENENFLKTIGEKTLQTYHKFGLNPIKEMNTDSPEKIGENVRRWLLKYMTSGPVVKMVIQGLHAVEMVRKLVGNTMPAQAEMGTIRGDFSVDSAALANSEKRAVHNLIHASGTIEEAEAEIKLWFKESDIHGYKRAEEEMMF